MTKTNLALKLQVLDPNSDLDKIMIGSSKFSDDVWDLSPFMPNQNITQCKKKVNFSKFANDEIKNTFKNYVYYKLGKIKAVTVASYIIGKSSYITEFMFLEGLSDFSKWSKKDILKFSLWLKEYKKVSSSTGFKAAHIVEEIIKVGQIKGWNVPQSNILKGVSANQLWYTKKSKQERKANKTKPIPKDIFDKILYHAAYDEKDILTKAGIIVQSQTGLRINEVLSLQKGCVKQFIDNGETYDYMEVSLGKTEKGEPILHKVFINELVKNAVNDLEIFTTNFSKSNGSSYLFLSRSGRPYKAESWGRGKLRPFIERWDIRDNKGNLYPLRSHQFRATFVRELIKRKVPIAHIMKQYSHVSIEMTSHYLTLQEEEVKGIYTDMIFSPESKIAGLRSEEIKNRMADLFHGKTEEDINEIINNLSKSMSFNPLPTGVCLYDFRRGNCSDGDGCFMYNCPNYITEVRFYPILKDELDLLEKEMARLKELGWEREWQKQSIKHRSLKPLVESLEVQLDGEESIR